MIKLLHVISDTNIGGAGRYLLTYLAEHNRKRYHVKVILPAGSQLIPRVEALKVEVITVDGIADKSFDRKAISALIKVFRQEKPDIVHTHAAISARIAAKLAGVRHITYTRHSVFPPSARLTRGPGRLANVMVNQMTAQKIIAVAEAAKQNVVDTGVSPDKISVIYNGVQKLPELTPEQKNEARKELGLPPDLPIIALAARVTAVKGQDYLIKAAKIVKDSGHRAVFVIAGTGDKEEEFKALTKELDLEDTVFFTGFIQDIAPLMNIMTIQANASYGTEAASLSLMEGMGLGKPAVVSDYGGNPELITNGQNGFIVPQKDPPAIANAIITLLDDKEKYAEMSKKSREIFDARFTAKKMTQQMEDFYESLII